MLRVFSWLILAILPVSAQLGSLFHSLVDLFPRRNLAEAKHREPLWIHSGVFLCEIYERFFLGKFQGDIDGIDERILKSTVSFPLV